MRRYRRGWVISRVKVRILECGNLELDHLGGRRGHPQSYHRNIFGVFPHKTLCCPTNFSQNDSMG